MMQIYSFLVYIDECGRVRYAENLYENKFVLRRYASLLFYYFCNI